MKNIRIALFASGKGSNAAKIIQHFRANSIIEVALVITNNENAGVVQIARKASVSCEVFSNKQVEKGDDLLLKMTDYRIDFIVLAGFLRKIPTSLTSTFSNRIINVHPALLPKFGGKGMFGKFVHQAVLDSGDKRTGITIHLVNDQYDKGDFIAQFFTSVDSSDDVFEVERKVQLLEHRYFPMVIEKYIEALKD